MQFAAIASFFTGIFSSKAFKWVLGIGLISLVIWLFYRWAKKQGAFIKNPNNGTDIPANWSAVPSVERLYNAFSGWGTDEVTVFDVLEDENLTTGMKIAIYNQYLKSYNVSLLDELKNELSGDDYTRALNDLKDVFK